MLLPRRCRWDAAAEEVPMLLPRRCRCCCRGGADAAAEEVPMLPPRREADAVAEGESRCRRVVPSVSEAGRQVSEVGVCRRNRLLRLRAAHLFASSTTTSSPGATSSTDLLLG